MSMLLKVNDLKLQTAFFKEECRLQFKSYIDFVINQQQLLSILMFPKTLQH